MASSSMASSSTSASSCYYEVFINHRGPDVKNTFASHLYRRLLHCGLRAFLDREEMEKGDKISPQIEHAIRGASVHIAIFSPRYAQSIWCLNELVLMKNSGATILPIFYKVEPSALRWTVKGAYAESLRDHQQKTIHDSETGEEKPRYGFDTIQDWRNALNDVADLSGFTLLGEDDDEGELLEKVVETVLKKVPKTSLDVAKYPTGLDLKLEKFEETVLSQQQGTEPLEAKVVGIVGVGGVGKTTLAKEFFNRNRSCYTASSFLSDVREVAGRMSINYLQSKLIKDLKHTDIIIDRHEGIEILKRHLSLCQVLIILDDVDNVNQMDAFLPIKDVISPNSLILVTSRDKQVLKSSGVLESSIYNLEGLDKTQSKELFCSYAFNQPLPLPPPEFPDLVDQFVAACKGLPLSLKVIGALLSGENDKCCWQDLLERLNHTLPEEIFETLRISYDSLDKQDRSIFLDIACFFIGEDIDKGIRIWGKAGVKTLENKCLLEVDTDNRIKMHDHIRDMGRKIAEERTLPCRLWDSTTNSIDNFLEQPSTVITEVRGIKMVTTSSDGFRHTGRNWFRIPNYGSSQISPSKYLFSNSHFLCLRNLQLVATEEDQLEDILRRVQRPHLIWLRWYRVSHSSLPDWIPMNNLRVLEVEGRRLNTLWSHQSQDQVPLHLRELNICAPLTEIPKSIGQLKYLERIVIYCPQSLRALERLPDEFCRLGSLKYLVFKGFSEMVSLPHSFGELTTLQHIDLEDASSLQTLPDSFGKLTRLKHLNLCGCKSLAISDATLGDITTLEYLNLSFCEQVNELPPQVARQLSLQELHLVGTMLKELPNLCCNLEVLRLGGDLLEMLPPNLGELNCLKMLRLYNLPQLKSLPDSTGMLTQLTELIICFCGIEYLPRSLLKMNLLEMLQVEWCPLREHPFKKEVEGETALNILNSSSDRCMFGLKTLNLSRTEIREVYFGEGVCPNLQHLTLRGCSELRQIGGLCGLQKLRDLVISNCPKVEELSGLETLTSLEKLKVWVSEKFQRIPGLWQLTKLRELDVNRCCEIQALEHLTSLEQLTVSECEKLQSIPGLGQLTKLRTLKVSQCREIRELSGVEHLTSLLQLDVSKCEKLQSIPGLGQLTKLRTLKVYECCEIRELSGVEHLTSLKQLAVSKCEKLQSIPGLGQLTKLRELDINRCCEIQALEHLTSLEQLTVSECEKLQSIPGLGQLTKLRTLNVSQCREIRELSGVEHLTSLERLDVSKCEKLQSIPGLGQLTKLRTLNVYECREIRELSGVEHLTSLKQLAVLKCEKLQSIPGLGQLTKLRTLEVYECREIRELPGVEHLTSLEELTVSECEIPGLGQLTKLRTLKVYECREIRELPGVEHLTSLRTLYVSGCEKLQSIPGLGQLTKLTELNVRECHGINELPGVEHLTSLERLNVNGLQRLKRIPGLGQFTNLKQLDVSHCHEISELPGLEHLAFLKKLNVSGLGKLKNIPVLGQFTQMKELNVSECHEISELPGLEHLVSLKKLNVSGLRKLKSIQELGQLRQIKELDVSKCHHISELSGIEHLISLEKLNISGLGKIKSIPGLGQLTQIRELNVSDCYELQELQGVEYLMALEIINACECPKLRWREGIAEKLRQQLKEGFKYEKERKRCSCLEFLQSLFDFSRP